MFSSRSVTGVLHVSLLVRPGRPVHLGTSGTGLRPTKDSHYSGVCVYVCVRDPPGLVPSSFWIKHKNLEEERRPTPSPVSDLPVSSEDEGRN